MKRRKTRAESEVDALIEEIKELNDAAKFHPDPFERDHLLAQKSARQSELLRDYGELFELLPEGPGTIGILHSGDDRDACHARVDRLDPDVRDWVRARIKKR